MTNRKKMYTAPIFIYTLMIGLGVLSGYSDIVWLHKLGAVIADIFIRIFKCISLPIIALSIIVTLSNYSAEGEMRGIWRRAITYTLATTVFAATISFFLYVIIQPALVNPLISSVKPVVHQVSYFQHIESLIPSTVFSPFLEQQVMSVLFLGILVGLAIRYIPDPLAKASISAFFKGAHGVFLIITSWVIAIIPIGLFGFISTTVEQFRSGMDLKGIGQYLLVIVLANLLQGFVFLPLWLKFCKIKPYTAMRGMLPALSLAFFSKSSVGTLPVTMETIETNLKVKPAVSRFILPLCTSLNMNGCAAFIFTTVIYLMQNNGLAISLPMMILWVFIATIAAIGNAGVPMGCFFLSASLLASMNVPISLMGIILPFYSLIDMLETALNVWSDACVTIVVDKKMAAVNPT